MTLMDALDAWEPALRRVAAAKAEMEANHYYRPLREAYEAAVADRDALGALIESLSSALPA